MKKNLHPQWYTDGRVVCSCGESWVIGSTAKELHTDVCSKCHPFFTGEQRIVDTEGQVDRFMRRLKAREDSLQESERRRPSVATPDMPITRLKLGKRMEKLLEGAGLERVSDVLARFEASGENTLSDLRGFDLKALADLRKSLRAHGFVLPGDELTEAAAPSEA